MWAAATLTESDDPADGFALEEVPGVRVTVGLAQGGKCDRCWKLLPEVGDEGLCERCAHAVAALGPSGAG